MAVFITYLGDPQTGEGPEATTLWGLTLPKGEAVETDNEKAIERARTNPHFAVTEAEARKAAPVVEPEPEIDEDLEIPHPGAPKQEPAVEEISIPDDWQEAHHFKRIKWAKQIRPDIAESINSGDEANAVIAEYLSGWE